MTPLERIQANAIEAEKRVARWPQWKRGIEPHGRLYSKISIAHATDEGDFRTTHWVSHAERIDHTAMTRPDRIDFVRDNAVRHSFARELETHFGPAVRFNATW